MNYGIYNIKIRSSWFDNGIVKTIGYKGYDLYLNLFRFYIPRQEHEYTFAITVAALRKETGYTSNEIVELIKLLVKAKVIETNISRWDRMYENNKLLDDKMFMAWASDVPKTIRTKQIKNGKEIEFDKPDTPNDMYVSINLDLMQHYKDLGLNTRSYLLHTLIKKLSNGTEGKCWMSINTMADILGIGDNFIHKLIYALNRNYLLFSEYRNIDGYMIIDGKKRKKKRFEHRVLGSLQKQDVFLHSFKDGIDKNIKKWDKRDTKKEEEFVEVDMTIDEINNAYIVEDELLELAF